MARHRGPPIPTPNPSLPTVNFIGVVDAEVDRKPSICNSFIVTANRPPGWTPIMEFHRLLYLAGNLPVTAAGAVIQSTTDELWAEARDWARMYASHHIYLPGVLAKVRTNVWMLNGAMMITRVGFRSKLLMAGFHASSDWSGESDDESDVD